MMSQAMFQDTAAIFFISAVLTGNKAAAARCRVTFSHLDLTGCRCFKRRTDRRRGFTLDLKP